MAEILENIKKQVKGIKRNTTNHWKKNKDSYATQS